MMRRTKRSPRHKCTTPLCLPCNGMDAGDLQCLLNSQRRQDGGNSPRNHRLARSRRSNHKNVMSAGNGDLNRPRNHPLSLDIRKILPASLVPMHERGKIGNTRTNNDLTIQVEGRLSQCLDGDDINPRYNARLLNIPVRDNHNPLANPSHLHNDWQDTANLAHLSRECQLPNHAVIIKMLVLQSPRRLQQANGNR